MYDSFTKTDVAKASAAAVRADGESMTVYIGDGNVISAYVCTDGKFSFSENVAYAKKPLATAEGVFAAAGGKVFPV